MRTRKNKKMLVKGGIGGGNAKIRWENLQFIIGLFGDKVESILKDKYDDYELKIKDYIEDRKKEDDDKKSSFKWLTPKKFGFKGKSARDDEENPIYKLVKQILESQRILNLMLLAFIIIGFDINEPQITTRFYIDLKDLEKILPDSKVLTEILTEKLYLPDVELSVKKEQKKRNIDKYYDKLKFNVHESVKKRIKLIFYYRALMLYDRSSDNEDKIYYLAKEEINRLRSNFLNDKVIVKDIELPRDYNNIINHLLELIKKKQNNLDDTEPLKAIPRTPQDILTEAPSTIFHEPDGLNEPFNSSLETSKVDNKVVDGGTTKRKRKRKRKRTKKNKKNKYK